MTNVTLTYLPLYYFWAKSTRIVGMAKHFNHICTKCIDEMKREKHCSGGIISFGPDETLRDILKHCVPHLNLHNQKTLSLCGGCVEILKTLQKHVTMTTDPVQVKSGKIPEDTEDFVKYCMNTFSLQHDKQNVICRVQEKEPIRHRNNVNVRRTGKIAKAGRKKKPTIGPGNGKTSVKSPSLEMLFAPRVQGMIRSNDTRSEQNFKVKNKKQKGK